MGTKEMSTAPHIMILAGEASGDSHAAEFVNEIKQLRPDIRLTGMGTTLMKKAGVEVFFDSASIAVVGLIEVLRHWGDIKKAMDLVKTALEETKPDLLILVDYPEFNLKMARHAKSLGIKVLFYISPQVWAWRPKRIHKIGRSIDHMAVLFKFEQAFYEKANIPVSFVGHPLVDKVKANIDAKKSRINLGLDQNDAVVGLFPGSRKSEIQRLLPVMLETAKLMRHRNPALKFILPVASTLDYDAIKQQCELSGVDIQLTRDDIYDLIVCCNAIVSCSGTVTLEIALLNTPMCLVYKISWLSYQIMSRLINIPHIGLANIVANKLIVKELLQDDATPQTIATELFQLLENESYRSQVISDLSKVRENLGAGGGAEKMAKLALSFVDPA
ncbi:MAG: lipid-A-disaccharide synthase [Cocleimonas sp.]|jgi:lipid-A-disaccharide synthase